MGNSLEAFRSFEDRPARHLADEITLDLLPRRLRCRDLEPTRRIEGGPADGQFFFGNQHISRALAQIDPHPVARFQQPESAAGGRFGAGVEDRRAGRCARLPTVPDARQVAHAFAQQISRRAHVDDFSRARITDRPGAAHHHHRRSVDAERRIVDPRMVILRPIEHHHRTFERLGVGGIRQVARAKFGADHAGFHDRRIEQVARQHDESGMADQRLVERTDHCFVLDRYAPAILSDRATIGRQRAFIDQPNADQLVDHRRHSAGMVEIFAEIFARWHHVDQQRHFVAKILPVAQIERNTHMPGDRHQVNRRIGRSPDRRIHADRVEEGCTRHDVGRFAIGMDHLDDLFAGAPRAFLPVAVRRRDGGRSGQAHAEHLGERIHRGGSAHRVAIAGRWRGRGHQADEASVIDLATAEHFARFPHDRAAAGALSPLLAIGMPAVEHRTDRQRNRRKIDGGRRHQRGRRGLVAADREHHAIERIAIKHFDQPKVCQVAIEPGGRALAGFLDRVDREFDRDPAGIADTFAHPLGQHEVVAVAWGQVTAGLRDADDRPARA